MAQFPLALAIEPKLLPYAVKNGFYMDGKVRIYFCAFSHLIDPFLVSRLRISQDVRTAGRAGRNRS